VHKIEWGQALNEAEGMGILTGGGGGGRFPPGGELWGGARNGVSLRPSFVGGAGSRQGSSGDR
jgi:hypothetical protein